MKAWLAFGAVVSIVVLGGCSSSANPDPSGSVSTSGSVRGELTPQEYYEAVAEAAPNVSDSPLGSADGDLGSSDESRFHVDVLNVQAWADATLVTFVLVPKSPDGKLDGSFWYLRSGDTSRSGNSGLVGGNGIRSVSLVDPSSGTEFLPAVFDPMRTEDPESPARCLCAYVPPSTLNTSEYGGMLMTAWMGPLPEGTETVTFRIAGADDIADLPVVWEQK